MPGSPKSEEAAFSETFGAPPAMVSYAVVAHEARLLEATELAHSIGAVVALDDGSKGAEANHLEAWRLTDGIESQWAAVLEDDAEPVDGFLEQAEKALAAAPEPVVSFYLGTGRPLFWAKRIIAPVATAGHKNAHWLTATHAKHAVAIAMHTDLREDWLDFAHANTLPIDERLSDWCITRRHKVAYSLPSLVDHADGPTLIAHRDGKPRDVPRKALCTGTREQWNSRAIAL